MKKVYQSNNQTKQIAEDSKKTEEQIRIEQKTIDALKNAQRKIIHKINSNVVKTANKTIKCDASSWLKIKLTEEIFNKMTDQEKKDVLVAKRNKFMIVKGDQYIRQFGTYDGKTYVSKFIQPINDICNKYNFYQF